MKCPCLHRDLAPICRADSGAIRIPTPEYLERFCISGQHRRCDLFRAFLDQLAQDPERWRRKATPLPVPRRVSRRVVRCAIIVPLALLIGLGCGTRTPRPTAGTSDVMSARDLARVDAIRRARTGDSPVGGYRLGPDDLLEVRIPDLLDTQLPLASLRQPGQDGAALPSVSGGPLYYTQGIRVAGDGTIMIPSIGAVPAQGRTASELQDDIAAQLVSKGILRSPHVSVLVVEYRSRVAAVVGSVERPGLYPITRDHATISQLVWAAGGPAQTAGRIVEFTPSPAGAPARPNEGCAAGDGRCAFEASGAPVRLDLEALIRPTPGADVDVPVRPGDVISLAPAGNVQVDGWVEKPGSYAITRGMTLTGAIAAAGGRMFPADTTRAVVHRVLSADDERTIPVDLDAIARGEERDIPIMDGDVVRLPVSAARMVPWSVWAVMREVIHIGGNVALF